MIRTLALAFALLAAPARAAGPEAEDRAQGQAVDLELVLLVDASSSISDNVLAFQLAGHAAALRDPAVTAAIGQGEIGAVAVTLVGFGGPNSLQVLVPWTRLAGAADSAAFADRIAAADWPRTPDSTAIGSAVAGSLALFGGNGFAGLRQTVDITSNGFSNAGLAPEQARALAEAAGVTVNALAILNDYAWLEPYYADAVIAGRPAFVATATDQASFVRALTRKLVREIVPVS